MTISYNNTITTVVNVKKNTHLQYVGGAFYRNQMPTVEINILPEYSYNGRIVKMKYFISGYLRCMP